MQKNSRSIRIAVALGAAGTALVTSTLIGGTANAGDCYPESSIIARSYDPCYTPATRPEDTTTTTEAVVTTTTETEVTTTTEGERPTTTMGTVPTTMGPTTTAPVVDDATGARPVAARPSYTG